MLKLVKRRDSFGVYIDGRFVGVLWLDPKGYLSIEPKGELGTLIVGHGGFSVFADALELDELEVGDHEKA